jgi:hypothetical protein
MSRAALEAALARAEANIAEASRYIVLQNVYVLEMGSLGLDLIRPRERLAMLEETRHRQISHRDRLQQELDVCPS